MDDRNTIVLQRSDARNRTIVDQRQWQQTLQSFRAIWCCVLLSQRLPSKWQLLKVVEHAIHRMLNALQALDETRQLTHRCTTGNILLNKLTGASMHVISRADYSHLGGAASVLDLVYQQMSHDVVASLAMVADVVMECAM
jgi:hypothetical protein